VYNGERTVFVSNADPICIANISEPALFTVSLSGRFIEVPVSKAVSDVVFGTSKDACDSISRDLESRKLEQASTPTAREIQPAPPNPSQRETSTTCAVYVTPNSRQVGDYSGECRNGRANGFGSFSFYSPRPANAGPGQVTSQGMHLYQGNFVDGWASGQGVLRAPEVGMILDAQFEFGIPMTGTGVIVHNGQSRRFRLSTRGVEFD
jgi:MORN repeat